MSFLAKLLVLLSKLLRSRDPRLSATGNSPQLYMPKRIRLDVRDSQIPKDELRYSS